MKDLSLFRLYVLRGMYLFIVVGLGIFLWPDVLRGHSQWGVTQGQASCMLAAFSLMCLMGLRYPVQMLPILLWEVTWKTLWLVLVPLPQWRAGHIEDAIKPSLFAISMVVIVYAAIPWGYVFRRYAKADGERWR